MKDFAFDKEMTIQQTDIDDSYCDSSNYDKCKRHVLPNETNDDDNDEKSSLYSRRTKTTTQTKTAILNSTKSSTTTLTSKIPVYRRLKPSFKRNANTEILDSGIFSYFTQQQTLELLINQLEFLV